MQEKIMTRVWADFNASTDKGLRLNCSGTIDDLLRQKIELKEEMRLLLWDEDIDDSETSDNLVVEAVAHFDVRQNIWVGVFEWSEIKHE